jgi:hypothetical protein
VIRVPKPIPGPGIDVQTLAQALLNEISAASLIPFGIENGPKEKIEARRIVESALKPSDWVHKFLDEHAELESQIGQLDGIRYEDLTALISQYADGMHIPKTTVFRVVKKRRS